ncbi:MAG: DUF1643 domain-containing protein [Akkermansiaceae bacterium]|nr:DUF1643 domain-containing protein [Akkermansiaceae bacterium]
MKTAARHARPITGSSYIATISPCGLYRYTWSYRWSDGPSCLFILLNPSTADQDETDPTVRRCIAYAKRWGFGEVRIGNLFAWRDTDPAEMKRQPDPIGPGNDAALKRLVRGADLILAAWGAHGSHLGRDAAVRAMLPPMHALSRNLNGSPGHPLYLRGDLRPFPLI